MPNPVFVGKSEKVNNYIERIDVKQGKLVLGFRADVKPKDDLAKAMRSFTDIFGGGPYSTFCKCQGKDEPLLLLFCSLHKA